MNSTSGKLIFLPEERFNLKRSRFPMSSLKLLGAENDGSSILVFDFTTQLVPGR